MFIPLAFCRKCLWWRHPVCLHIRGKPKFLFWLSARKLPAEQYLVSSVFTWCAYYSSIQIARFLCVLLVVRRLNFRLSGASRLKSECITPTPFTEIDRKDMVSKLQNDRSKRGEWKRGTRKYEKIAWKRRRSSISWVGTKTVDKQVSKYLSALSYGRNLDNLVKRTRSASKFLDKSASYGQQAPLVDGKSFPVPAVLHVVHSLVVYREIRQLLGSPVPQDPGYPKQNRLLSTPTWSPKSTIASTQQSQSRYISTTFLRRPPLIATFLAAVNANHS